MRHVARRKPLVRLVPLGSLLVALSHPVAARQHSPDEFAHAIDRFAAEIARDVATDGVGSITAGVMRGNTLLWTQSFGWADRRAPRDADAESIYRVGSISKTVTAVVLLRLVDDGVVALDDPVVKHLPEFARLDADAAVAATITLRQLASHTGGLIREPGLERAAAGPIAGWGDKILASIPTTSLLGDPAGQYSYSNIGYGILGFALERAAGRPFMDLVQDFVFDPLNMTASTFILSPSQRRHLTTGYANRSDGTVDAEQPDREHAGRGYKVPNGGVYTTVADLMRFAAGLAGASPTPLMSDASRREMLSVQTPESATDGYGLGVSIRTMDGGRRAIGHGGSVAGYNAYMIFEPESQLGVLLLRNYNRGETNLGRAANELLAELTRIGAPVP